MSNALKLPEKNIMSLVDQAHLQAIEHALARNDLSKLDTKERIAYYNAVCVSVGLNPLTQPFAYIEIDGKMCLYARKECAEQLRRIHGISTEILSKVENGDFFEISIRAKDRDGRIEENFASVYLCDRWDQPFVGVERANAKMKAITKATRRVTLALSGLGMIDESELESIKHKTTFTENPQIREMSASQKIFKEQNAKLAARAKPTPEADLGEFVCKVGKKYLNKKLKDIDQFDLNNYLEYLLKEGVNKLKPDFKEFVSKAEKYLQTKQFNPNKKYQKAEGFLK